MPKNDPKLPKLLRELGVIARELPRAAMRQMHPHSHAEAQLCGLDAGLAIMETSSGSWLCPPGRCVWIPPGIVHSLRSCGKISGWTLHVEADRAVTLPQEPRVLALSPLLKAMVLRVTEWTGASTVDAPMHRLVDVMCDEIAGASQLPLHLPMPHDAPLVQLAARLAEGDDTEAKLSSLAHEVGISERSLFRRFQQETGMSPGQWRRQMQMLRALELLVDGRTVTETSLEVGYESTGAFIRAFRQVVGTTPAVYAQKQRMKSPQDRSATHDVGQID